MSAERTIHIGSAQEMQQLGEAFAGLLRGGELLALDGPLGAGKTQFVQGLARGLGVPPDCPVVSPTFVLVREYAGRLRLYHLDAYRLRDADELEALGWQEMRDERGAVVVIEWADRVVDLTSDAEWRLQFAHAGEHERGVRMSGSNGNAAELERVCGGFG